MAITLGLDLGTNSIGWSVVDTTRRKILKSGVRIFPEGVMKDSIGKGEQEETRNASRRAYRQARRGHYRKRLRKIKLLQTLIQYGMCPLSQTELKKWNGWDKKLKTEGRKFPNEAEFVEWLKLNPYELRDRAVKEAITRSELGRIFYHFIQRRGFLSSRKGNEDGAIYKGNENMEGISKTQELVEKTTLGSALYQLLPENKQAYRRIVDENNRDVRPRARYTLREMYVSEFERIWNMQADRLGLKRVVHYYTQTHYIHGSHQSSRNKRRIDELYRKYGQDNVKVMQGAIQVKKALPLKEYLAGKIQVSDNKISFRSNDSVLFYQRPLRSQKALLSKCTFEQRKFFDKKTNKTRVVGASPNPKSHPDYELFRALQFVNTIKANPNDYLINQEFRDKVLAIILAEEKIFPFERILKKLKLSHIQFNYEDKHPVPACPTHKKLSKIFGDRWLEDPHTIWHYFHFYTDADLLAQKLQEKYQMTQEKAESAAKIKLTEGYGNVSLKAIRNILPFLKMGKMFSTAVVLGGVKNAFGQRWDYFRPYQNEIINEVERLIHSQKNKEFELIQNIKDLLSDPIRQYGFELNDKTFRKLYHPSQVIEKPLFSKRLSPIENLRNPIVQQALHELRRLVNELLNAFEDNAEYGPGFQFDRIQVELSRDLKSSKTKRREMLLNNRENEQHNLRAKERLQEFGLKPSRENITKYKLFEEIEQKNKVVQCPYTNKTIRITELLGDKNLIQIEHIIPYSVSLDDSFINKTLCESNFNRMKGELTPYEFYQKNNSSDLWGASSWEEIEERAFKLLPYQKAKRFVTKKRTDGQDFIARQLNDNRYISKKAAELLHEICEDVRVLPGRLTSELRRLWNLNHILQPAYPLNLSGYSYVQDQSVPHWVVLDQNDNPIQIYPKFSQKPASKDHELLIVGEIDKKGLFTSDDARYFRLSHQTYGLAEGKYWARISYSNLGEFNKIFVDAPSLSEDVITYRGRVINGQFNHDSIPATIKTLEPEGDYYLSLPIMKRTFSPAEEKRPEVKGKKLLLFGKVGQDGLFSSYNYQVSTQLVPGKYWLMMEVDFNQVQFQKATIDPPQQELGHYLVGRVDDFGIFESEIDPDFNLKTKEEPGKYFAQIENLQAVEFHPILTPLPALDKNQKLIEGNIWIKNQEEVMFDPKKNREDQRHHAIDAVVIALTETGYLQKLSTYFGNMKGKERGLADRPTFEEPWEGFEQDVKRQMDQLLVSYKSARKPVSQVRKIILKNGKKYLSQGISVRGKLHREYYFGQHPQTYPSAKGFSTTTDKKGQPVFNYHIRKPITSIENNKHVEKIVDAGIKKLIIDKLRDQGINVGGNYKIPANFFFDKEGQPLLFLPNKRGQRVPIKKIRLKENMGNAQQLKNGKNQWVNPYNNHHVVIYKDHEGQYKEQVVSFWEVIERIQQGQPVYQLPPDGKELVTTMEDNEMFLVNLPEDLRAKWKNSSVLMASLSPYLYRLQKKSSVDYFFRHHLASTINNDKEMIRVGSFKAWERYAPVKVLVDQLGQIKY